MFQNTYINIVSENTHLLSLQVDQNVTRHIKREMLRDDWDILILHYLGLDHIGHLTGPSSSLVPSKLKEMDLVIKTLHESLQQWVCSDSKIFLYFFFNIQTVYFFVFVPCDLIILMNTLC